MRIYDVDGYKIEVIREEVSTMNYTLFSKLVSLINDLKNDDPLIKEKECKDNSQTQKT